MVLLKGDVSVAEIELLYKVTDVVKCYGTLYSGRCCVRTEHGTFM